MLVLLSAGLVCLLIFMVSTASATEFDYIPKYEYQRLEIFKEEEVPEDTYVIPKDEWFLKLVNKDNPIGTDYIINVKAINSYGYYFDERAIDKLFEMMDAGTAEGMQFKISSGYRTIERQTALYQQRINELLAAGFAQADAESIAASQVSPPGTSEHNLGLGVDIVSAGTGKLDETFEQTAEFKWLMENCTEYGFILRYPKDKEEITKVTYEPWHYRYVGVEDAKRITEMGVCLEEYLA